MFLNSYVIIMRGELVSSFILIFRLVFFFWKIYFYFINKYYKVIVEFVEEIGLNLVGLFFYS